MASVAAVGAVTGDTVEDDNPYHAIRPGVAEETTTPTESTTPGEPTTPSEPDTPGTTSPDGPALPSTGADTALVGVALTLLVAGATLLVLRRRRES